MALIECKFFSEVLGLSTAMLVILPHWDSDPRGINHPGLMTERILRGRTS